MLDLDDLADLGITPDLVPDETPDTDDAQSYTPRPLVDGSVPARTLYHVWKGDKVTIVKAPPGSGKTQLVVDVLSHLLHRTDLSIYVACPTNAQVASMATRLLATMPTGSVRCTSRKLSELGVPDSAIEALSPKLRSSNVVTVGTLHSLVGRGGPQEDFDILIIDEAYQATFAMAAAAANKARQVLLVGDPGQIGPVVTVNTSAWASRPLAPHRRSPEAFATMDGANIMNLSRTYRVGERAVRVLASMYDFAFDSGRPPRHLEIDGVACDEIEHIETASSGVNDLSMLRVMVERAQRVLNHGRFVTTDGTRGLSEHEVCLVAARNTQTAALSAMLDEKGLSGVCVGTADKLQGGQWPVVIALDPLAGADSVTHHSGSVGRLCVMASRHMGHLTWVSAPGWERLIGASELGAHDKSVLVAARRELTR